MKHLGTQVLHTRRLILRPFSQDDAEEMFSNWAGDSQVTKFLRWKPHKTVEDTRAVLADWIPRYACKDYYLWAIVLDSEPVGSISVVQQDDQTRMFHIGYCIGRPWWHQGMTSEALAAVIQFLFKDVGANRIESRHDPNNPHSGKVMRKCGMRYEGLRRQADWNNQGICDSVEYAILAEDYLR